MIEESRIRKIIPENFKVDSELGRYRNIKMNLEHSRTVVREIKSFLNSEIESKDYPATSVVACGSYARLDASNQSDLDLLIVNDGDESDISEIAERLYTKMAELGIPKPNPKGVFSDKVSWADVSGRIGSKEDSYDDLSRRLLLLLESRPVFGEEFFEKIVDELISKYSEYVITDPRKNFVFLLNDLIRYFRTICVNYQFTTQTEWGKWPIRNVKLRHSRVLMYASLLTCIGTLSVYHQDDKPDLLREFVRMTPLERLKCCYEISGDTGFYKVAGYYDTFLGYMGSQERRDALKELEHSARYDSEEFSVLKANSDALSSEMLRFIWDRKGQWSDRFFEYLIL